ncbi:MAG: thioredoxin domain-containing protein [Aphanothece sp. CMT-3BRIN-NPC111]|jgi:protein-disulfide isomerase|nr:thioredoxin domain-containing protein [Aphanothece sp. CMT-3BRIN-NPC111]
MIKFLAIVLSLIISLTFPLKTWAATLEEDVLQIIRNHPEVIIESVQQYQIRVQQIQAEKQAVALSEIKANPQAFIGSSPSIKVNNSKIFLLEFSDFQCPFCAQAHKTVKEFMDRHRDEVTLVYKHFPITQIHPEAMNASLSAWAAGQQGKFWEYHDQLFDNQNKLGEEFYVAIAKNLKLDVEKFNRDRRSDAARNAVMADVQLSERLGINSTPFFILNGQPISGAVPLSTLEAAAGL